MEQVPARSSAPGVGLVMAAATAPGTFAPSLSRRSALDQGIVTGLATGLHHLLAAGTQDLIEVLGQLGMDEDGMSGTRRRRRTAVVDCVAAAVGLAVWRSLQ